MNDAMALFDGPLKKEVPQIIFGALVLRYFSEDTKGLIGRVDTK